ncbi:hypothetical protein [Kordia jejudonensis]|uniref:hypothetical protein n=1 Tax=Kordia jejudonensis TaxID=1348245 RepID=UPI000629859C|nr:hypothetical protein [Kordia jejudonensis]
MNIEKLLALDRSQIKNKKILFVLTDFIGDYEKLEEDEKEEFLELSVDEIKKISIKIEQYYPGIFESASQLTESPKKAKKVIEKTLENTAETPKKKESIKKKEQPKKKSESKPKDSDKKKLEGANNSKSELDKLAQEIQQCRIRIREYNKKKNQGKPEKPKLKRYEKIERQMVSIWNLMPDYLKVNESAIEDAKVIITDFIGEIMKIYRMNPKQIDSVQKTILEKFKEQRTKINKDKNG